jgi:hypothetical protein
VKLPFHIFAPRVARRTLFLASRRLTERVASDGGDTTRDSSSHSDDSRVEGLLAPPAGTSANQKKGYSLVPHYDVAPRDISSSLSEDNIITSQQRANNIIMEPSADDPLTYSQAVTA